MIRTVRHKGLRRFVEHDDRSRLPAAMVERIRGILTALGDAERIEEMDLPGYRLHTLKGDLKGFYAVTVRANWRIVFRFEDGDAFDVDLTDYH
jgi:proteic killer suppression protein